MHSVNNNGPNYPILSLSYVLSSNLILLISLPHSEFFTNCNILKYLPYWLLATLLFPYPYECELFYSLTPDPILTPLFTN